MKSNEFYKTRKQCYNMKSSLIRKGGNMKKNFVVVSTGGLRVLLFDIETAPNLAYVWGKYEQDVLAYKKELYMLSFSYKWLGTNTVYAHSLPEYKIYKKDRENDVELIQDLWKLFDEADIIIAHNGDKFDIRMANSFFAFHGMKPPAPYKTVDTLKVARAKFKFNSNKLNDLGEYLKLGSKVETGGFKLWTGCLANDKESWRLMVKYNKQDVVLLEKVYLTLRPWMTNHPNLNINYETNLCPVCGSDKMQCRGFGYTLIGKYQRYQCQKCGKWSRGKNERTETFIR